MDASQQQDAPRLTPDAANRKHQRPSTPSARRELDARQVGEILGRWQAGELRIARGFAECRGCSSEQLEDLYQATALALMSRPYLSEEHLRGALRTGIKQRAQRLHRDERTHARILAQHAASIQRAAESRQSSGGPEQSGLGEQDRLVVLEFLTELSALEQRVFWLETEGMRYRAIADVLGIAANEARNASRSCERKRERFQLLYDTGRLCGYRASTITALQHGEATSEQLANRAFAHLERCASCRAEHRTNARRLRRSFQDDAAALLPFPALLARAHRLAKIAMRARLAHQRAAITTAAARASVRGWTTMLGSRPGMAQLAAGIGAAAVIAAGTVSAGHAPQQRHQPPEHRGATLTTGAVAPADTLAWASAALTARIGAEHGAPPARRRVVSAHPHRSARAGSAPGQAAGFAYLGIAAAPSATGTPRPSPEGGPFSP